MEIAFPTIHAASLRAIYVDAEVSGYLAVFVDVTEVAAFVGDFQAGEVIGFEIAGFAGRNHACGDGLANVAGHGGCVRDLSIA